MLLDHIFYIANRIGWEHVGLGSDFDGEYHLSVLSSVADTMIQVSRPSFLALRTALPSLIC
jgi:microsomal dipeptidase-like Zn-dependent dipeptidase